ncbi:helix-turn-helix domain-containing protein [Streptomyces sp. BBFR102]|uniref:helix-turn-helix domain-containing protein n=1 Tax=Streptomyces sp. BBFR102 TaxID=3448171 RepID=UPI003F52FE6F
MSLGKSPEDNGSSPAAEVEDERPATERAPAPESAQPKPEIGRTLARARTEAGLGVDEVSAATRVRVPIIQAIEQDDFSRCGGDVYARGHIRTLARAVGVDPAPLIAAYDADHGGRPAPTVPAPLFEAERIRSEPRRANWTAAMVAAIVAVVGFVGFTLFNGDGDGGAKNVAGENGSTAPPAKPSRSAKPDPKPSESAIAAAPADRVTVKITVPEGRSWLSAKDHNGQLLFDGTLAQGQTKTFTDKERVDLVIGDAGAVELLVNGKEIEDRFQPGQVQRLSYTKGDPNAG